MKFSTIKTALAPLALAATVATGAQAAETLTTNLSVTATVLDTCTLAALTGVSFANIDTSTATNQATAGLVNVICTGSRTGITVTLGAGGNESGGVRKMKSVADNLLPYALHSDSGHANAIAVDGTLYSGPIAAATLLPLPVYGQIPAGSYNAGIYSDTILVTLTY